MKINIWIKVPTLITCIILCIPALLFAEDKLQTTNLMDPAALMESIATRGSRVVLNDLYSNTSEWLALLRHVATGDAAWLRVASALYPVTDAGAAEMLPLAVGEALGNNPINVFQIASKTFELKLICGGPDVDDSRFDSYELSMKAIDQRIQKIRTIKDQTLTEMTTECIKYLEESKKDIARFYQVKTK
jgi:hypothetical protein